MADKKETPNQLLIKLQKLLKEKCWKITFNYDEEDGFFCEVDINYSFMTEEVADLKPETKRKTLKEAIRAAIAYLENPTVRRFRM